MHYCVNMLKAIESLCFGKSPELIVMYRLPFNKIWASCSFLPPAFHSVHPQKEQGRAAPLHPAPAAPPGPAVGGRPIPEPPPWWGALADRGATGLAPPHQTRLPSARSHPGPWGGPSIEGPAARGCHMTGVAFLSTGLGGAN